MPYFIAMVQTRYKESEKSVAIIGAGSVGRSIGWAVQDSRFSVDSVVSRTVESAEALASDLGVEKHSTYLGDSVVSDIIVICVPDASISLVADILNSFGSELSSKLVVHTSGLATSESLSQLQNHGAFVASFHPLQTFTRDRLTAFHELPIAIEGNPRSVELANEFAEELGGLPFELSAESKPAYHLAATLLSNYSVVLARLAQNILSEPGLPALDAFERLLGTTWANIFSRGPSDSLTGPVSRGDVGTVQSHLDLLGSQYPEVQNVYRLLGLEATSMALRQGSIDGETAEEVIRCLTNDAAAH